MTNLTVASVNTTAVTLTWLRQTHYEEAVSYLVAARNASDVIHNKTTTNETYTFADLTPGTSYQFDVLVVVSQVKSEAVKISSYTSKARWF